MIERVSLFHKKTLQDYLKLDDNGRTPLHWAARNGRLDQVMAALEASGEKLTLDHFLIKDNKGRTPLHGAAMNGHLDQVMAALEASGEKLTPDHFLIKDNDGSTPLHEAVWNGHLDQVFIPSYWTGRVNEMIDLWDQVPQEYREKAEDEDPDYFQKLRDEAILLSRPPAQKIDPQTFLHATRAGGSLSYEAPPKIAEL